MTRRFQNKDEARQSVWDALQVEKAAAFPFPPHGRIPNFKGSADAARRLFTIDPFATAKVIKVNPDSAQRAVRLEALRRGITVFVPTPRLAGGFMQLDPGRIPVEAYGDASTMSKCGRHARTVALVDLPQFDAIVCGSVAVTREGFRCGKGAGFADVEFAILAELGHRPVPVATTVHELQIVKGLPQTRTDLPLSVIVTPDEIIRTGRAVSASPGIDWNQLDEEAMAEMPVLQELRALKRSSQ